MGDLCKLTVAASTKADRHMTVTDFKYGSTKPDSASRYTSNIYLYCPLPTESGFGWGICRFTLHTAMIIRLHQHFFVTSTSTFSHGPFKDTRERINWSLVNGRGRTKYLRMEAWSDHAVTFESNHKRRKHGYLALMLL